MTLPSAVFWTGVALVYVFKIRNGGLTVRDALLEILGRRKPTYHRAHVVFGLALGVGALGLWYWLYLDCRAALG